MQRMMTGIMPLVMAAVCAFGDSAPLSPAFQPRGHNAWDFWFAKNGDTYHAFYLEYPDKEALPDQSRRHGGQWVGHAVSKDLAHWEEQAVALKEAPARGIATGSCVRDGDRWYMLLTYQGFTLAESADLEHWQWKAKAQFPAELKAEWKGESLGFRMLADPFVYPERIDGWWYAAINSQIVGVPKEQSGAQVLMRSKDLLQWETHKVICYPKLFERIETAQFWAKNGKWYLHFGGAGGKGGSHVYIADRFDGPYEERPWSQITLPGIGYFYLGKRVVAPDGSDVFLAGQNYAGLSVPIRMTYGPDGAITFGGAAQEPAKPDYTSRVPKFVFAETLQEQEAQLKTNPLVLRFSESRKNMSADPYRPLYHFVSPESAMNDPNGLCFWQGRWHLFYQGYPPEDKRQHWGHTVSDDLIHWRDLPYAIYPNPEEKCFSGATLVEKDRVIAMYHGTKVGNMVALSHDPLLLNWEKVAGKAVIPTLETDGSPRGYPIFDPCVWKKGEFYYSLSGGTQPTGTAGKTVPLESLFRSKDLATWEYLHPFVENDRFTQTGDDGACPYFWPVGDRHILLFFSHTSGGQYLLGDYDTPADKFFATAHGKFNHGPMGPAGVHAPSATPDGRGGLIAVFNMNPGKGTKGWNQLMTLPMRLTLTGKEELGFEPAGDIASLRDGHRRIDGMALPANQDVILPDIRGNAMEIAAEIDVKGSPLVELNLLRSPNKEEFTRIAFLRERGYKSNNWTAVKQNASVVILDNSYASAQPDVKSRMPEVAQVYLDQDEPFKVRVFIDRSVVEVFVNGRQVLAARVYPGREDSVGVSLRAQGSEAKLKSLDAWQMRSIY